MNFKRSHCSEKSLCNVWWNWGLKNHFISFFLPSKIRIILFQMIFVLWHCFCCKFYNTWFLCKQCQMWCSNIIYILFLIYVIPIDEERPSSAHSQISVKEAVAVVDNTEKVRYWLALINNNDELTQVVPIIINIKVN